jgi:hypothetical protein
MPRREVVAHQISGCIDHYYMAKRSDIPHNGGHRSSRKFLIVFGYSGQRPTTKALATKAGRDYRKDRG